MTEEQREYNTQQLNKSVDFLFRNTDISLNSYFNIREDLVNFILEVIEAERNGTKKVELEG